MTPQEQRVWAQMERQAAAMTPELRAALFVLYREVQHLVSDAELARLLRARDVDGIVRLFVEAMGGAAPTARVREAIRTSYARTARTAIRVLPIAPTKLVTVAFDSLSPHVVDAIRALESRALGTLTEETAAVVRQVVERGLTAGVNPRALVPELRGVLGLAPNQEQAVANYRQALIDGDMAKARGYRLRDKRFDPTLKKGAPLTEAQVERMTAAYREKWRGFNAQTHARTTALDATRAGQQSAWNAAIEGGVIEPGQLMKRWITTIDGRQRPEHEAMHRVEIPFRDAFPVDGGVQLPGQNTYNCRCALTYRVLATPFKAAA